MLVKAQPTGQQWPASSHQDIPAFSCSLRRHGFAWYNITEDFIHRGGGRKSVEDWERIG
jgi:hypothetical protein